MILGKLSFIFIFKMILKMLNFALIFYHMIILCLIIC